MAKRLALGMEALGVLVRTTIGMVGAAAGLSVPVLPALYAHLFSLSQIREVFARQVQQGKGPSGAKLPEKAEA